MSDQKLVLHPANPWAILQDPPALVDSLRGLGLVGAGFSHEGDLHYRPGPRFAELVAFKATAPGAAPEDPARCHVSLLETSVAPLFLGASNSQGPVCTACGGRLVDWRKQLVAWQSAPQKYLWDCPKCHRRLALAQLDWGTTGGIARYSLDVWGVAEGAAAPSPELLAFLGRETAEPWRFFYYRF